MTTLRPIHEIAADAARFDALGYPLLALWLACFIQAYEATAGEAA